jgi:CRP-like cAMP-binding protein
MNRREVKRGEESIEIRRENYVAGNRLRELTIGWDSEYDNTTKKTLLVSTQLYCIQDTSRHFLIHPNHRYTFQKLITYLQSCYPEVGKLTLVCHFSRAELNALDNTPEFLQQEESNFLAIQKTIVGKCRVGNIKINIIDTYLLTIKGLDKLGEWMQYPKGDDKGYRERGAMIEFMRDYPEDFYQYAMRDAEICCMFYQQFRAILKQHGLQDDAITIGSVYEKSFSKLLKQSTNRKRISNIGYKYRKKNIMGRSSHRAIPDVRKSSKFLSAYYGGRNETYLYGKYPDTIYDYDLKSAYGTAMSLMPECDPQAINFTDAQELYHYLQKDCNFLCNGLVDISNFRFRDDVKYPSLLNQVRDSLIYVREGSAIVTAQEFLVSYPWLAECTLSSADIYPIVYQDGTTDFQKSLIAEFTTELKRRRDANRGNEMVNQVLKLVINSGYGKFAQGLKRKRKTFDIKTHKSQEIKPSNISNAYVASYITGFIRAMVSEYLHYCGDNDIVVGNVTTDGFTTLGRYLEPYELTGCGFFTKSISNLLASEAGTPAILELKHQGRGGIFIKTRAYTMLEKQQGYDLLSSLSGVSMRGKETDEKIRFFEQEFDSLYQYKDTRYPEEQFPSVREWIEMDCDFIGKERLKGYNWDYDFKRMPVAPQDIDGRVRFATVPFNTLQDYLAYISAYRNYGRGKRDTTGKQTQIKNKITTTQQLLKFDTYARLSSVYRKTNQTTNKCSHEDLKIYCQYLHLTYNIDCNAIQKITNRPRVTVSGWIRDCTQYNALLKEAPEFLTAIINTYDEQLHPERFLDGSLICEYV